MRTSLFIAALALVSMAGCAWSEFDDLADTTWVRSTDEPNVGSRNYALAIVGLTTGTSGGQLGVVSDDTPDYSTIDYDSDGADTAGGNDVKLGQHRIAARRQAALRGQLGQQAPGGFVPAVLRQVGEDLRRLQAETAEAGRIVGKGLTQVEVAPMAFVVAAQRGPGHGGVTARRAGRVGVRGSFA